LYQFKQLKAPNSKANNSDIQQQNSTTSFIRINNNTNDKSHWISKEDGHSGVKYPKNKIEYFKLSFIMIIY